MLSLGVLQVVFSRGDKKNEGGKLLNSQWRIRIKICLFWGVQNFIQNCVITYFNHTTSFHGDNSIKLPKILFSIQMIALDILCVAEEPPNSQYF